MLNWRNQDINVITSRTKMVALLGALLVETTSKQEEEAEEAAEAAAEVLTMVVSSPNKMPTTISQLPGIHPSILKHWQPYTHGCSRCQMRV